MVQILKILSYIYENKYSKVHANQSDSLLFQNDIN